MSDRNGGFDIYTVDADTVLKFGNERLLTWRTIGQFDDEGMFEPQYWLVWRLSTVSDDELILDMINAEFSGFKGVDKTRRDYERVIKRNIDDPALFAEKPMRWIRVREEHFALFRELADEVLAGPED